MIENKNGEIHYMASSPDEVALINFARFAGFEFQGIDAQSNIQILYQSNIIVFKLLHILEFNSTRKR